MKVALTAIARHENKYLKEWIDFYQKMGINHIFLGDNNDTNDTEDIQSLIDSIGYQDFVTVINKRKDPNVPQTVDFQTNFYKQVYDNYGHDFDWMCFFDIDEFLEILPQFCNNDINQYIEKSLSVCKNNYNVDAEQIMVGWLIYNDNNRLFYEDKPVQERFTQLSENIYREHMHRNVFCGKCIVKCGLDDVCFPDMHHTEFTNHTQYTTFNGGKDVVGYTDMGQYFLRIDCVLKHYYSKSLEEFITKRLFDKTSYTRLDFENCMRDYFSVNHKTLEKEKIFELYKKILQK